MIGTKELLKLVHENKLVDNLCERELKNPEGSGFDLRLGEVYKLKEGEAFLGLDDRHTPQTESVAKEGTDKDYILRPGDYRLVKTMEKVNLPSDIIATFQPRSTLQRCGVSLYSATVNPGYSGELTFGIKNIGNNDFRIELGTRFVHILFDRTGENVSDYRGQWQGGRVSTEGETERQV